MEGFIALLPALCSFVIGLVTHRILLALAIGVGVAALLSSDGEPLYALHILAFHLVENVEPGKWSSLSSLLHANKVFVIGFIILSTALFELIYHSKGIDGLYRATANKIKSKRGVETASLLFSHSLFIDGCLSSLLVSSLIRPFGERYGVHRLKTALLADSMAGPLVALCPFSCFTAIVVGLLANHGVSTVHKGAQVSANATELYFLSVPYLLYSLVIMLFFWLVVQLNISIGPMRRIEKETETPENDSTIGSEGTLSDFVVPAASLPFFVVFWGVFFGWREDTVWEMVTCGPISLILFLSAFSAIAVSGAHYIHSKRFTAAEFAGHLFGGAKKSFFSVMIIVLAWTLASILSAHLSLSEMLSEILGNHAGKVLGPFFFFVISAVVATSLGTSWGTVAILVPLIVPTVVGLYDLSAPVTLEDVPLLAPSLGAVVSGAAFGDHASLLSDSTFLSCHGARCSPVEHIRTQWPYALPALFATSMGFLVAGFTAELPYGWLAPLIVSILVLFSYLGVSKATIGDTIPS